MPQRQVTTPRSAPPLESRRTRRQARRRLTRLARALRRRGWTAVLRPAENPPRLRVFHTETPCVGETVTVIRGGAATWWYASSTGTCLAPVQNVETAADDLTASLTPWIQARPT